MKCHHNYVPCFIVLATMGLHLSLLQAGMLRGVFHRGLTLPTRGLKYSFQGIMNAKTLQQNRFPPSEGVYSPKASPGSTPGSKCRKSFVFACPVETVLSYPGATRRLSKWRGLKSGES